MRAPLILLAVSLAGLAVALALPGWSDLLLLAGPAALASLYLVIRALARGTADANHVILDGSNVMHWRGGEPDIDTVRDVLDLARDRGLRPGIVFDANAGYLLFNRYVDDADFARVLNLPPERVLVVPKGTPADPTILAAARDLGARVISNDRYRDWLEAFPEFAAPGQLIRGGIRRGDVWLEADAPRKAS